MSSLCQKDSSNFIIKDEKLRQREFYKTDLIKNNSYLPLASTQSVVTFTITTLCSAYYKMGYMCLFVLKVKVLKDSCMCAKLLQLCPTLCDPMDYSLPGSSVHWDSPGKKTREGCQAPRQVIFRTQGSIPLLLHCRRILYLLSLQGSQVHYAI